MQLSDGHQAMINSLAAFQSIILEDGMMGDVHHGAARKAQKKLAEFVVEFGKDLKGFMRDHGYVVTVVVSKRDK